mmetsp:Transcript_95396/g.274714  ORF Transcript_95396/g.274714 Transcript_95396/m.274714 type:complete len:476 (-) Transcript_95396:185-1612(-)
MSAAAKEAATSQGYAPAMHALSNASTTSGSDGERTDSFAASAREGGDLSPSIAAAFLFMGSGCGWFVCDSLYQLLANVPETQNGGRMFGVFQAIGGWMGMLLGGLYFLHLTFGTKLTFRQEQASVAVIIASSTLTLVALAGFWHVGAPSYPVVIVGAVVGNIVANLTYFTVLPLIATHYGGRLVSFVRAGSDTSGLVTASLAEFENPTGNYNKFPPSLLFVAYAALTGSALLAWASIVKFDIALIRPRREASEQSSSDGGEELTDSEEARGQPCQKGEGEGWQLLLRRRLAPLACPGELLMPVLLATACCSAQWSFSVSLGPIAAKMTDPAGCDGHDGHWVFRQAVTCNRCLLPLMSLACSLRRCPRSVFVALAALQLTAAAIIISIALGFNRELWMSRFGHYTVIACYSLVGGLDGYVYSMAYRYIGEMSGISSQLRKSSSSVLGLLSVVVVNPLSILVGSAVKAGIFACVEPA